MKNWKVTCSDGFTKALAAATMDEAVDMALIDGDLQDHFKATHPEMAGKAPEEMKEMVKGMITEEMSGAMGPDMGGGMPPTDGGSAPMGGGGTPPAGGAAPTSGAM